jgi:hypothetical protein
MATGQNSVIVGVFEHRPRAEQAVAELWRAGFPHDRIDMVTREGETEATPNLHLQDEVGTGAIAGAVGGASAGAIAGAIAVMLVPGLGTILGGGLLAGVIGGAALGAAGGTFLGPFVALQMNEDDAHYYAHAVDEGKTIVIVKVPARAEEARAILLQAGASERQPAGV